MFSWGNLWSDKFGEDCLFQAPLELHNVNQHIKGSQKSFNGKKKLSSFNPVFPSFVSMEPFSNTMSTHLHNLRCTGQKCHLCCRQSNIFFFPYYKACMWDIPSRILHNKFCVASSYSQFKKHSGILLGHQKTWGILCKNLSYYSNQLQAIEM